MKQTVRVIALGLMTAVEVTLLLAETSTRPTQLPGSTSIAFEDSTYVFHAVGVTYTYSLREPEPGRGTLRALTIIAPDGETIRPSNFGGIKAELAGSVRAPWDEHQWSIVHHRLVSARLEGDSAVVTTWTMQAENDSCHYAYRFSISGQTLVIRCEGDASRKAVGIGFSNANTRTNEDMRVIALPCLTLMNVLFAARSDLFVSLFVDWENSNASGIRAWYDGSSNTTGYFSEMIEYEPLSNGTRNRLVETAYLSASKDMSDVLPNIVPPPRASAAPLRDTLLHRIIVSYFNPFSLLNAPRASPGGGYIGQLDSVYAVKDVAFLVKNWNAGQFDHNYPRIWPPDPFQDPSSAYGVISGRGGAAGLKAVASTLKRLGYLFGLHENYVDYYETPVHQPDPSPVSLVCGLLPGGHRAEAFDNADRKKPQRSYLLKPSTAAQVATAFENGKVRPGLSPNSPGWCYLDVSSSVNPSGPLISQFMERPPNSHRSYVDFDTALGTDAGKFIATVRAYRKLAQAVRKNYGGPVQGEGGNHFLYAGYFDGFEGRLSTGDGKSGGYGEPLLIAFAQKIRDKSAVHGVGHIQDFFGDHRNAISDAQVKIFMATELAYGHGGLVTVPTPNLADHSLKHAQWEQRFLLPVQKMYADAEPVRVTYFDASNKSYSASDYIRSHSATYSTIADSVNFMGRIGVVYSNGLEVWVNRTKGTWDLGVGNVGRESGWFSYNASIGGPDTVLSAGRLPGGLHFVLPRESGWVCYSPKAPAGP